MKNIAYNIAVVTILGLFSINTATAQNKQANQRYNRNYDVNTVETIEGTVKEIKKEKGQRANATGIHLIIEQKNGAMEEVHLGPVWFIDQQEYKLKAGDKITVTGSRINYNNRKVIIAAFIVRGDMELRLRNNSGFPRWRGWRGRGMGRM